MGNRYSSDKRWQRVRRHKLRRQPTCERCGDVASQVHHRDHRGLDGPARYSDANLESLCQSCHSKETVRTTPGGWAAWPKRKRDAERYPGMVDPQEAA